MAGMTTAMLIGAGINGAVGLFNAHKAGKAADKAVTQQTASADKALALQKEIYNKQAAALAPYTNAGAQAVGTLGHAMGFAPMTAGAGGGPIDTGAGGEYTGTGRTAPPGAMITGHAIPRPDGMRPPHGWGMVNTLGEGVQSLIQGRHNAASSIRTRKMRAPDGEIADVPEAEVEHYSSLGATEVS
jgi:hypothetical protein